jgi:hypothetical protein
VPADAEALQLRLAVDHQQLFADRRAGQVLEGQLQFPLREATHLHAGLFSLFDQRIARFAIGEDRAHAMQGARWAQQQVVQEGEQQRPATAASDSTSSSRASHGALRSASATGHEVPK